MPLWVYPNRFPEDGETEWRPQTPPLHPNPNPNPNPNPDSRSGDAAHVDAIKAEMAHKIATAPPLDAQGSGPVYGTVYGSVYGSVYGTVSALTLRFGWFRSGESRPRHPEDQGRHQGLIYGLYTDRIRIRV